METIRVNTAKPYNIIIGKSILKELSTIIDKNLYNNAETFKRVIIICDSNISHYYLNIVEDSLKKSHYKTETILFKSSEKRKNINEAAKLCNQILSLNINRNTLLLALGGGMLGDLVGFCASILLRGIPLIFVPTTLLSAVDSAIGGKTGVNSNYGKNLLGTFYQPSLVIIDTNTLTTLSYRDYISGYAECLKYSLLFDASYFHYLVANENLLIKKDTTLLKEIIRKSCEYKATVVKEDEFEKNDIRVLLNLGHTFAHAFETYNNYKTSLTHGEAVAIGMLLAFKFSKFLGIYQEETSLLENHLINVGLPIKISTIIKNLNHIKLVALMQNDKKNQNNNLNMILPKTIGNCLFIKNINPKLLQDFFNHEVI